MVARSRMLRRSTFATISMRKEQKTATTVLKPGRKRTPLVPDTGAPLLPTRHTFGGHMKDLDGKTRKWNDRWQNSLSALNDNYHPDHRAYFTQYSLFEESPSQRWHRFLDQEVEHGVWEPIKTKKRSRFPPLGARMRGRSGTPIPGATF
mmetsp:Transcript_39227/g.70386  ORF Transcript_39227/g.70386 Transcript_39227/m.70386 type:complete len:149 (-) Transcript_39227:51-497(-)